MADVEIKAESLPQRCEICHQTDCFDATTNYCSRCGKTASLIKSENEIFKSVGKVKFNFQLGFLEQYWLMVNLAFRPGPLLLVQSMFPLAGVWLLYLLYMRGQFPGLLEWTIVISAFFFSPLLYLLILSITWVQSRKHSRNIAVTLNAENVRVEAALATTEVKWSTLLGAEETKNFFYLYITKRYAVVIPQRVISDSDLTVLRQFLHNTLGKKAKLRDII
jgi:hypothetical protein